MPDEDKDRIQQQVLKALKGLNRRAFRGPIALQLRLATTDITPSHLQHIAKNLLDLFGKPGRTLETRRRGLVYSDDQQVHALSVTCDHGNKTPSILVSASPLNSMLADLDLATRWARESWDHNRENRSDEDFSDAIDEWRKARQDERRLCATVGTDGYKQLLRMAQQRAQQAVLGNGALRPQDLAAMYDTSGRKLGIDLSTQFERIFSASPLRIQLSGPPQREGSSSTWKKEIETKLKEFQQRYNALIEPWLVPVALVVLVKPPIGARNVHDLDNVVRTYLIPKILEILKPVSDLAFAFDPESIRKSSPDIYELFKASARPPKSTKLGLCRYEVWRLPPAKNNNDAFVSVAVVADMAGAGDALDQVDALIEDWRTDLEQSL